MYTWDPQKAITNFEKHGVSFEEAALAFLDEQGLELEDLRHSTIETRYQRVASSGVRILFVVYTLRETDDGEEEIRIISARQASQRERRVYAGS